MAGRMNPHTSWAARRTRLSMWVKRRHRTERHTMYIQILADWGMGGGSAAMPVAAKAGRDGKVNEINFRS